MKLTARPTMKLTVNTNHLALIDRVVEAGMLGKSRGDVLKGAVVEHVGFLLAGGTPFRTGPPGFVEVDTPTYGPVREEQIIQPITFVPLARRNHIVESSDGHPDSFAERESHCPA